MAATPEPVPGISRGGTFNIGPNPWEKKILLTLDGGGIRDYWSLLVLESLMREIGEVEEEKGKDARAVDPHSYDGVHSFWPQPWPDNVSHVDNDFRYQRGGDGDERMQACKAHSHSQRFLPCHYFDYIGGSSTGGLIAIMLGRLRMSAKDCIDEYERLGGIIFGQPRLLYHRRTLGAVRKAKYSASNFQRAVDEVVKQRCEDQDDWDEPVMFPSKPGTCRTFVSTKIQYEEDPKSVWNTRQSRPMNSSNAVERSILLRSYAHRAGGHAPQAPRRTDTWGTIIQQPNGRPTDDSVGESVDSGGDKPPAPDRTSRWDTGPAANLMIGAVARAATAAPLYFKPLKARLRDKVVSFTDGGFSTTNNPSMIGRQEIVDLHGSRRVGMIVSVGTARTDYLRGPGLFDTIKKMATIATDPEVSHSHILGLSNAEETKFTYYRFNSTKDDVLKPVAVDMDDWLPRSSGDKTLDEMRKHFNAWYIINGKRIQSCAKQLVATRRKRAAEEYKHRWERFAIGADWECYERDQDGDCCFQKDFSDRQAFNDHLRNAHQIKEDLFSEKMRKSMNCWRYRKKK